MSPRTVRRSKTAQHRPATRRRRFRHDDLIAIDLFSGFGGLTQGRLPVDFMLLQPPSWHPDVWTDVARMRTLNMIQARKGKEQHLCPMQFDIADRLIDRWSNPGDVVYDPFAGIMTVPYCAVKLGRVGIGVELNPGYWRDGVAHVESVAQGHATPTLFDEVDVLVEEVA